MERLSRVNVTSLPGVESKSYHRVKHQDKDAAREDDGDRFYFGLDIGPYWYKPLGRVFALAQTDVEREALQVIRTELNHFLAEVHSRKTRAHAAGSMTIVRPTRRTVPIRRRTTSSSISPITP